MSPFTTVPDEATLTEQNWDTPRSYALIENGDLSGGTTVLPFLCGNCGFVRLHAPAAVDASKLAGPD